MALSGTCNFYPFNSFFRPRVSGIMFWRWRNACVGVPAGTRVVAAVLVYICLDVQSLSLSTIWRWTCTLFYYVSVTTAMCLHLLFSCLCFKKMALNIASLYFVDNIYMCVCAWFASSFDAMWVVFCMQACMCWYACSIRLWKSIHAK